MRVHPAGQGWSPFLSDHAVMEVNLGRSTLSKERLFMDALLKAYVLALEDPIRLRNASKPRSTCEKNPNRPFLFMKKTRRRKALRLPAMMTELMSSSFETIARRSWMLAQGKCSPTECARMVLEKQQALALSGFALLSGASAASILAPFHRGATANAKRLRRK
jgi:hypothetical protein